MTKPVFCIFHNVSLSLSLHIVTDLHTEGGANGLPVTMSHQDRCPFCEDTITDDKSNITRKGLVNILNISSELKDGLDKKLKFENCPIPAHLGCTRNYSRPSNIRKRKNDIDLIGPGGDNLVEKKSSKIVCRSHVPKFDMKSDCLFCGLNVDIENEKKKHDKTIAGPYAIL